MIHVHRDRCRSLVRRCTRAFERDIRGRRYPEYTNRSVRESTTRERKVLVAERKEQKKMMRAYLDGTKIRAGHDFCRVSRGSRSRAGERK